MSEPKFCYAELGVGVCGRPFKVLARFTVKNPSDAFRASADLIGDTTFYICPHCFGDKEAKLAFKAIVLRKKILAIRLVHYGEQGISELRKEALENIVACLHHLWPLPLYAPSKKICLIPVVPSPPREYAIVKII